MAISDAAYTADVMEETVVTEDSLTSATEKEKEEKAKKKENSFTLPERALSRSSFFMPERIMAFRSAQDPDKTIHYISINSNGGDNFNNDGAKGENAMAIGHGAKTGDMKNPFFNGGTVSGAQIAFGKDAQAYGHAAVGIGHLSHAKRGGVAIGFASQATFGGIAIGPGAHADFAANEGTDQATANTGASYGIAIGRDSRTATPGGVALGTLAVSDRAAITEESGKKDAFLGDDETVRNTFIQGTAVAQVQESNGKNINGAVSIGRLDDSPMKHTRQLIGLAAGTQDTDAVNVAQLKALKTKIETHYISVKGYNKKSDSNYDNDGAKGEYGGDIAIGEYASSSSTNGISMGYRTSIDGASQNSIAMGWGAIAENATSGVALGAGAEVKSERGVALGALSVTGSMPEGDTYIPGAGSMYDKDSNGIDVSDRGEEYKKLGETVDDTERSDFDSYLRDTKTHERGEQVTTPKEGFNSWNPQANEHFAEWQKMVQIEGVWTPTEGDISVGNYEYGLTRRITNLAGGSRDNDAVNVAQLKLLANMPVKFYKVETVERASEETTEVGALTLSTLRFTYGDGFTVTPQKTGDTVTAMRLGIDGSKIDLSKNKDFLALKNQGAGSGSGTTSSGGVKYFSVNDSGNERAKPEENSDNSKNDGASGGFATAVGVEAKAYGETSIALGTIAIAKERRSNAVGYSALASKENANAFGAQAQALGENSSAFGDQAGAMTDGTTAIGSSALAIKGSSTSIGYGSSAIASSTTVGTESQAFGKNSVIIGMNSYVGDKAFRQKYREYNKKNDYIDKPTYYYNNVIKKDTAKMEEYKEKFKNELKEYKADSTQYEDVLRCLIIEELNKTVANGVAIGNETEVSVSGGVAIGSKSKATRKGSVIGYNLTDTPWTDLNEITEKTGIKNSEKTKKLFKEWSDAYDALDRKKKEWESATTEESKKKLKKEFNELMEAYNIAQEKYGNRASAWLSTDGAVSIGNEDTGMTRQLTGIAAGSEDTDAVNVAQLKALNKKVDTKAEETNTTIHELKTQITSGGVKYFSVNPNTQKRENVEANSDNSKNDGAIGVYATAIGLKAKSQSRADIALGYGAVADSKNNTGSTVGAIAIGANAKAEMWNSVAIGTGTLAEKKHSIAMGKSAKAMGTSSIAMGQSAQTQGEGSVAIGRYSRSYFAESSVALGESATTYGQYGVALGYSAKALDNNAVVLGRLSQGINGTTVLGTGSHVYAQDTTVIGGENFVGNQEFIDEYQKYVYSHQGPNVVPQWQDYVNEVIMKDEAQKEAYRKKYKSKLDKLPKITNPNLDKKANEKLNEKARDAYLADLIIREKAEIQARRMTIVGAMATGSESDGVALGSYSNATRGANQVGYNPMSENPPSTKAEYLEAIGQKEAYDKANLAAIAKATEYQNAEQEGIAAKTEADRLYQVWVGEQEPAKKAEAETQYKAALQKQYELLDKAYDLKKEAKALAVKKDSIGNIWMASHGAVSIGDEKKGITRQITNLAAGSEDTDAVNVAQLKALANVPVSFSTVEKVEGQPDTVTKVGTLPLSKLALEYADGLTVTPQKTGDTVTAMRIGVDGSKIDLSKNQTITNLQKSAVHFVSIKGDKTAGNYKNDGATGSAAIAIGEGSRTVGDWSAGFGSDTLVTGDRSVAIGAMAVTKGDQSFAGGHFAHAFGKGALALGWSSKALWSESIAIGHGAKAQWSEAATEEQYNSLSEDNKALFTEFVTAEGTKIYYQTKSRNNDGEIVDVKFKSIAIGTGAEALENQGVALGYRATMKKVGDLAVGAYATADADHGTAIGYGAIATAKAGVAMGFESKSMRIGGRGWIPGLNPQWENEAEAIAYLGLADTLKPIDKEIQEKTVISNNAKKAYEESNSNPDLYKAWIEANNALAVAQEKRSKVLRPWLTRYGDAAIGNEETGMTRQLTGVAAGSADTDAVNVAQLKALANVPATFSTVTKAAKAGDPDTVTKVGTLPLSKLALEYADGLTVTPQGDANKPTSMRIGVDGSKIDISNNSSITNITKDGGTLDTKLAGYAKKDASNLKTEDVSKWKTKLGIDNLGTGTMSSWKLKATSDAAGTNAETIENDGEVIFGVSTETGETGLKVTRKGKTMTYGIDKDKLVTNIAGDIINQINNTTTTTTPITNISTKFTVQGDATPIDLTMTKDQTPNLNLEGEADKIDVTVDKDGTGAKVTIKANAKLGETIDISKNSSITNITNDVKNITKTDGLLSKKADKDASNLEDADVTKWKTKLGIDNLGTGTMSSFKVKTGDTEETVANGETIEFFAEANKGLSITQKDKKVTFAVDGKTIDLSGNSTITTINENITNITKKDGEIDKKLVGYAKKDASNLTEENDKKAWKKALGIQENSTSVMSAWKLKATSDATGTNAEEIKNNSEVTFGTSTEEKQKGLTITRTGSTITYGINHSELVTNIAGDIITEINKTTNKTKITNVDWDKWPGMHFFTGGSMSNGKYVPSTTAGDTWKGSRIVFGDGLTATQLTDEKGNIYTKITAAGGGTGGTPGLNGKDGKSAFDIWKEENNKPTATKQDFLKAIKGQDGTNGTNGADGKSVYDTWKETTTETDKSEANFLKAMKGKDGKDGTNGTNGVDGKSVYDTWKETTTETDKSEANFLKAMKGKDGKDGTNGTNGTNGTDGKSVYDTWKETTTETDKSEANFLKAMKGKDGLNGKSAYEIWRDKTVDGKQPNKDKKVEDFLKEMKGGTDFTVAADPVVKDKKTETPSFTVTKDKPQLHIVGDGGNISTTIEKDNTVKVSMKDEIKVKSIEVGGKDGVKMDEKGIHAGKKQITDVAAGQKDSDAVNVGQLKGVAQQTGKVAQALGEVKNESTRGDAMSAALTALKPLDYDPYRRSQIMAGVGTYKGKQAAALGWAHYSNENTLFHGGISYGGTADILANMGVSFRFGDSTDKKKLNLRNRLMPQYAEGPMASVYVMQEEVTALRKENETLLDKVKKADERAEHLEKETKDLKDEVEAMKKQIALLLATK